MTLENFILAFQKYLLDEKNALSQKSQQLRAESREDENKFTQIELNIVDIFSQMFAISCKKTDASHNWQVALKEAYLPYFEKIPQAWLENLNKCTEHGLDEEAMIETLKLGKAAQIKEAFTRLLAESV